MNLPVLPKVPSGGILAAVKAGAPTGMVVAGCVGIVGGVILACNATLKADAILDEIEKDVEKVNHVRDITTEEKYSKNDYQHDLTIAYAKGGAILAKLYLPAAIIILGSIALILGGHKLLLNRYTAGVAAYELLQEGYDNYRSRVREAYGEDVDRKYAYGLEEETVGVIEEGEDGKSHKKKVKVQKVNKNNRLASPFAFYWDNTCNGWEENPYYNETFLIQKQAQYNRELGRNWRINGMTTLAEIMKDLGVVFASKEHFKRCSQMGWKYDPDYKPEEHDGRQQIDLGIFSPKNSGALSGDMVYILDPNCYQLY